MTEQATKNWDPALAESFVGKIMNIEADKAAIMDEAKEKCAPLKEDISFLKKQASDNGIPRKELNALIATAKRLAKDVASYDKSSDEEKEVIDIMRDQFGFIPMSDVREQLSFEIIES